MLPTLPADLLANLAGHLVQLTKLDNAETVARDIVVVVVACQNK